MKKALVLGVLAFFAINCATVNAQDRTNVQEKGKKSYNQEPASKKQGPTDTKNVNAKQQDPTQKNLNTKVGGTSKVQGTKTGNKVTKNKSMNDASKKNANGNKEITSGKTTTRGNETEALKEKTEAESEQAPSTAVSKKTTDDKTKKNVTGKKTNENKSVPPAAKEKKNVNGKKIDNNVK